jgi:signal transduction histidine kinase
VRHFEVKLQGSSSEIQLTIRDAGVGFDPQAAMKKQGLGLISMHERVSLVKGRLSITSKPQFGTEINVRVPLLAGPRTSQAKAVQAKAVQAKAVQAKAVGE